MWLSAVWCGCRRPKTICGADSGSPRGRNGAKIFWTEGRKGLKGFWFSAFGERSGNHRLRRGAISENKPVDSVFEHRLVRVDQQVIQFQAKADGDRKGSIANANSLSSLRPSVRKFFAPFCFSITRNSGESQLLADPFSILLGPRHDSRSIRKTFSLLLGK